MTVSYKVFLPFDDRMTDFYTVVTIGEMARAEANAARMAIRYSTSDPI